jgi:hypothetical protein
MIKKPIGIVLAGTLFLICLVGLVMLFKGLIQEGRSMARDIPGIIPGTECLLPFIKVIPDSIPQRKPYDESSGFDRGYYYPIWWKPQLNIIQKTFLPTKKVNFLSYSGKNLWVIYTIGDLHKIDVMSGRERSYKILDRNKLLFDLYDIFQAKDGTIWAAGSSDPRYGGNYSSLVRYLPEKDKFEVTYDKDGLFIKTSSRFPDSIGGQIAELSNGFLIVLLDRNLFLYNPQTNTSKLVYEKNKTRMIFVDQGDNVWFINDQPDNNIYRIDLLSGKITDFGEPPQLSRLAKKEMELLDDFDKLTFDKRGNIWVSYFDRLEPDNNGGYQWKSLILPTIMIDDSDLFYSSKWFNVRSSLVDPKGNIWFTTDDAIIKYIVQDNNWCLSAMKRAFTNNAITVDGEGNIWTIDLGQIYKLESQR